MNGFILALIVITMVASVIFAAFLAKEVGLGKGYRTTLPELTREIDQYAIQTQLM